jgi:protein-disulfide isomerase
MSKEKKTEEKEIKISSQILIVPIALLLVAIIVAVIIITGGKDNNDNTDDSSSVEGSTDFGDYSDYITDGVSSSIDDDAYLGDKDTAKIAIVEFTDYQCYYCYRHTTETLPDLLENYVDTGEVLYVFRDDEIHGDEAEKRAEIGECVHHLDGNDAFASYHEKMMTYYSEDLSTDDIYNVVSELGFSSDNVKACYEAGTYKDEILADADDASNAGISGTPGFIVGILDDGGGVDGYYVSGALPYDTFVQIIKVLESRLED